ncbi:MAG: RND family transporter [Dehalococcoidales bacterium]|nr:RND family transporter [Dehalococcoidales bacterium]
MYNFFKKMGIFIENKRLLIIIVGLIIIASSVFGALRLTAAFDNSTFVDSNSQVYKDYTRFTRYFSSDVVVVMVSGNTISDLLQPENLSAMENIENRMSDTPGVISVIGPTFFIKQAVAYITGMALLPQDENMILGMIIDPQTGRVRSQFSSVLPDDKHALIAITLEGELSEEQQKFIVDKTGEIVESSGFVKVEPVVTGLPVIMTDILSLLTVNLLYMFIVAIVLMLLILVLVFNVRGFFAWRWLPLGVVLIAIIYTFGAMGLLSIPITFVSMAVFPIVIGLGVDYAIQFHNRYDEESARGETIADAIIDSVTHIGPSIGIAIVAACAGFAALFFSPVPMIKDFGYMLIIGVISCYLVSMFILLTLLYWRDRNHPIKTDSDMKNKKAGKEQTGRVERVLQKLAPWIIRNPAIILPVALVLTAGGLVADSHINTVTEWSEYLSSDLTMIQNYRTLETVTSGSSSVNLLVEAQDVTEKAAMNWILQLEQKLLSEQSERVGGITSIVDMILQVSGGQIPQDSSQAGKILKNIPAPIKKNLISDDCTAANIILSPAEAGIGSIKDLQNILPGYISDPPAGVNVTITGSAPLQVALFDALSGNREKMTAIGICFVFLVLLLLFRFNIIKALLAILPIGLIIGWSSGFMYLTGIEYTPVTATLGTLIMGIGVEFTILLMMRYYEERNKGNSPVAAMTTAITKIGRAIIASGLTVIGGFAALLIAKDFIILRDFGIVTVVDVFFALVSTLFVLPSLIVWIDTWRDRRISRRTSRTVG